jgi:hypothetical protein
VPFRLCPSSLIPSLVAGGSKALLAAQQAAAAAQGASGEKEKVAFPSHTPPCHFLSLQLLARTQAVQKAAGQTKKAKAKASAPAPAASKDKKVLLWCSCWVADGLTKPLLQPAAEKKADKSEKKVLFGLAVVCLCAHSPGVQADKPAPAVEKKTEKPAARVRGGHRAALFAGRLRLVSSFQAAPKQEDKPAAAKAKEEKKAEAKPKAAEAPKVCGFRCDHYLCMLTLCVCRPLLPPRLLLHPRPLLPPR